MDSIDEKLQHLLNNFTLNVLVDVSQKEKKDYQEVFLNQLIPRIKEICGVEVKLTKENLPYRMEEFRLLMLANKKEYSTEELTAFYKYWTETSGEKSFKMRFEKQPTFSIAGRLAMWHKNQSKFSLAGMINKGRK